MSTMETTPRPPLESIVPSVETSRFTDPQQEMWVGIVAMGGTVVAPDEYKATGRLRANVYIDEMHFLPSEARLSDGTESDVDDARSRHYAVLENTGEGARAVGTIRAIIKRGEDDALPVERLFPEVFAEHPAPVGSLEASRFIARSDNKNKQHAISFALIRAIVAQAAQHENNPIYAVVEEPLRQRFIQGGIPFTQISEAKPIPEYNDTENMVLQFDPEEIIREATEKDADPKTYLLNTFFGTVKENEGLGYYKGLLTYPIDSKEGE